MNCSYVLCFQSNMWSTVWGWEEWEMIELKQVRLGLRKIYLKKLGQKFNCRLPLLNGRKQAAHSHENYGSICSFCSTFDTLIYTYQIVYIIEWKVLNQLQIIMSFLKLTVKL